MLKVNNIIKKFGGLIAVNMLSFQVDHDILGVMGPNGSGKTTMLNCISGIYQLDGGEIYFKGDLISGLRPYEIARRGIGRTFQVPRLFWRLTLIENMLAPVLHHRKKIDDLREKAAELLDYVGLYELRMNMAAELSGGQQKLLEFARALMFDPDLLLLDEPFAGVHPQIQTKLEKSIRELYQAGKSFILVSHDIASTYALSTRIIAMDRGQKIAEGNPHEIQNNERVIAAYLGD